LTASVAPPGLEGAIGPQVEGGRHAEPGSTGWVSGP